MLEPTESRNGAAPLCRKLRLKNGAIFMNNKLGNFEESAEIEDGDNVSLLNEQSGKNEASSNRLPYSSTISNAGKIDHCSRQCIFFSLVIMSAFGFVFVLMAPLLLKSSSSSSSSARQLLLKNGETTTTLPDTKFILPSYPIFPKRQPIFDQNQQLNNETAKLILFWTSLFFDKTWRLGGFGREPFLRLQCPVSNCLVTDDRTQLAKADAVLVHFRDDFIYTDRPKPSERKPNQLWTFVLWETPEHTYHWIWQSNQKHYRVLKNFSNFFNWTMTYRLDSDVQFHYGRFVPIAEPNMTRIEFNRLGGKTKTAVWMTSHCDTPSHRETFVKQLMQHIDVDTIGGCDSNLPGLTDGICARRNHFSGTTEECLRYLSGTYKFYLSFENALCRDYVTEKFYRAATLDLIPVVYNGANMSLFAPPHSYIDAQQFESPYQLADYLKKVGSDPVLYNSYFWWKPFYDVEHLWDKTAYTKHFCDLCAKVNFLPTYETPTYYSDIDGWWTTDGNCQQQDETIMKHINS